MNFVLFRMSRYDSNLALMPLVPETLPTLQQKRRSPKLELQVRAPNDMRAIAITALSLQRILKRRLIVL